MKRCLLLVGALLLASPVFAATSQVVEKPLVGQSLDSFNAEAAKIREHRRDIGREIRVRAIAAKCRACGQKANCGQGRI